MSKLMVLVRMKAKAGSESALERELLPLQERTRAEPGCLYYTIGRSMDDPAGFGLAEMWASREDLDIHLALPHMRDLFARLPEILDGPIQISMLTPFETG